MSKKTKHSYIAISLSAIAIIISFLSFLFSNVGINSPYNIAKKTGAFKNGKLNLFLGEFPLNSHSLKTQITLKNIFYAVGKSNGK